MQPKTILALDLATTTGWAEGPVGGRPIFGSIRLAPAGASQEEIFAGAIKWIGGRLMAFRPDILVFEESELFRLRSGKATKATIEVLFGLPAVIGGVAHRMGVPVIRKAMTCDVRKHFIDHARMKRIDAKAAVIAECRRRGWGVKNDDEADALALWDFMSAVVDPAQRATGMPLFRGAAE